MTTDLQRQALDAREPSRPILDIFPGRWSPRAFDGTPTTADEMHTILEAARWAPSSYNEQEWRFVYGLKGTPHFDTLLALLVESNQAWCEDAGALIHVSSRTTFKKTGKPNVAYAFDAGLATQNLLLQAASMGLATHCMVGFNKPASLVTLDIPQGVEAHCMIAVGRQGDAAKLSPEMRALEAPNGRNPLGAIAAEGRYDFDENPGGQTTADQAKLAMQAGQPTKG